MAVSFFCRASHGGASGDGREFHEMAPSVILLTHAVEDLCRVESRAMKVSLSLQVNSGASCEPSVHGNAQLLSRLQRRGMWNSGRLWVTGGAVRCK